jgi:hypothetical protein
LPEPTATHAVEDLKDYNFGVTMEEFDAEFDKYLHLEMEMG